MKKSLPIIAAVLLAMSAAAPVLRSNVAFADDEGHGQEHAKVSASGQYHFSEDGNFKIDEDFMKALLSAYQAKSDERGDHEGDQDKGDDGKEKDKHKKPEKQKQQKPTVQPQQLAALKAAIAQLHKDQALEAQGKNQLNAAAKDYISLVKSAIQSGNVAALQQANQGISTILTQLNAALGAQKDEDVNTKNCENAGKHGDLAASLQAVKATDQRVQAKTKAMQAAAAALKQLVTQLKATLQGNGASTTTGTTSTTTGTTSTTTGTTSTTTGTTSTTTSAGNVTVTVPSGAGGN